MKVKIFQPNARGKIEFTRAELEKLLNEIYEEGRKDCERTHHYPFVYNTPYYDTITNTITTSGASINSTSASDSIDKLTCNSVTTDNACANSFTTPSFTLTIGDINTDSTNKQKINQQVQEIIDKFKNAQTNDPFTTLAKELNF